jgi:5-methylcytosine-specific restriction endonuclease McrA
MQSENGRRAARGSFLRRRDRETGLASRLSLKEINQVYTKFNNRCYNCGTSSRLEIDHHKPLSSGYGLTLDNAVILCRACNASKKDKLPEEFYTEQQIATLATILHDDG